MNWNMVTFFKSWASFLGLVVGAYGNVGSLLFLTVLSFTTPQFFFLVISATSLLTVFAVAFLLKEPRGATAEIMPDGTVQMIEVE